MKLARPFDLSDVQEVAVADYRQEDYARVYRLAPGGGGMEKTYEEWKEAADAAVVRLALQGLRVVRVTVDPDEFEAWLKANRLTSTSGNRARYVAEMADGKHKAK
jgi:hypothetical protein